MRDAGFEVVQEARAGTWQLALEAFHKLSESEGIIPALESAHALGWLLRNGKSLEGVVVVNLSGRGDKDVPTVAALQR